MKFLSPKGVGLGCLSNFKTTSLSRAIEARHVSQAAARKCRLRSDAEILNSSQVISSRAADLHHTQGARKIRSSGKSLSIRNTKLASTTTYPGRRDTESTSNIQRIREAVKELVETAIQRRFGRGYSVDFFGSLRYRVAHEKSDLDMVVIDPGSPQGYLRITQLDPVYNIRKVAHCLRHAGFSHIDCRLHSSVPIVKFRDPRSGLECDLNINDRLGIINSDMIKRYCDISPVLRPMLFSIKNWAKPLHLNDPSPQNRAASFSSYAFALMTIGYLQKGGHLPNLQDGLATPTPLNPDALVWSRKPHQGWDVRFHSAKDWLPPVGSDADALLNRWFAFWAEFPYDTEAVSIREGGIVPRITSGISVSQHVCAKFHVTDPFILTKNVTTAIGKNVLKHFTDECRKMAR
ncbi:hypothetical protein B0H34DRAFT_532452 [Crassisporium funariophilum]|nr:hypothetical protein B0H34DRAFT_532452 [Crassisporium funariophilum]